MGLFSSNKGKKNTSTRARGDGPKIQSSAKKKSSTSKPKAGPAAVSPKAAAGKRPQSVRKSPAKGKTTGKATGSRKVSAKGGKGGKGGKGTPPPRPPWYWRRSWWGWAMSLAFTLTLLMFVGLLYFAHDLPDISGLNQIERQPGITVKTADGIILGTYGHVYGDWIMYEDMPPSLVAAVMATEDRRFFDHFGIDVFGIARAMVVNVKAGGFVQGGSTITQQVAKNVFLTPERTIKRKIQEMLLAFWLENQFSKQEILEIYLNRVYLGSGTYVVDAAAERYFGKSARDMNVMESAIIAGLLKAPSRYAPTADLERSKQRAKQVLLNMVDAGVMKADAVDKALAQFDKPEAYREGNASGTRYFTDWIVDQLPQYLGNITADVEVITTLDAKMQTEAEDTLRAILEKEGKEKNASQAALLAMTPSGAIRAMVGGKDYYESQYNRATQAKRQAGSTFKLFVYLAALEAGITPNMLVEDAPIELEVNNKTWRPTNYANDYKGIITVKEAFKHSVNTVSVVLAQFVGMEKVVEVAKRLGINDVPNNPSTALGAVDSNVLELTGAYAHLANRGRGVEPYGILKISDKWGNELYKRSSSNVWVVLRKSTVEMMNNMLLSVVDGGTGGRANIGRPVAGKTGTSQDFRDAWFVGFTPQLVTGVWVGNDDNAAMKKVTGGNLPAMIWHDFMALAMKDKAPRDIPNQEIGQDEALPWQEGQMQGEAPAGVPAGMRGNASAAATAPTVGGNAPVPASDVGDLLQQQLRHGAQQVQPRAAGAAPGAGGFWEKPDNKPYRREFWNKLFDGNPPAEVMEDSGTELPRQQPANDDEPLYPSERERSSGIRR